VQQRPKVTSHRPGHGRAAFVVRRIYDVDDEPGHRVLVDRLWPRGVSKQRAALDEWLKDVAPSTELRHWYGHEPSRFAEFRRRYRDELERPPAIEAVRHLRDLGHPRVVLLTATRDIERSGALVLCDRLAAMAPSPPPPSSPDRS
jgi:uncharacterized protein YeaO (DUF488 family)